MNPQEFIHSEGIEAVLNAATEYADTQASLYGSLNDHHNYHYWAKVLWSLTFACDHMAIDDGGDTAVREYQRYKAMRSEI